MAWDGFPFSLVLFSRLYVVEFWWFPPPPPRCPRCIDYWTDALTHNVTLCLNTCSTDQSLITSNTRLESSKTANQPISKAKLGKVNLFALIQAICGHFWKVDEVFEYMCLPLWCCRPPPLLPIFQFHPPRISPQRRNEMEAGSKLRDKSDLVSTRRHYIQTPVGMSYFTLTPSKRGNSAKTFPFQIFNTFISRSVSIQWLNLKTSCAVFLCYHYIADMIHSNYFLF